MGEFNFKSSGIKFDSRIAQNPEITPVTKPFGIKTPLSFDPENDKNLYKMNRNPVSQIKDNLKNLILTNRGERLGRPNFGCNLKSYEFDFSALSDFESQVTKEITEQIKIFMPFVEVKGINYLDYFKADGKEKIQFDSMGLAAILIKINFDISRISALNQSIEIIIFVGG